MSLEKALKRPDNYWSLKLSEQWDIDKKLGILDWEPTIKEAKEYQKILREKKIRRFYRPVLFS